jgi:endoglucanase
VGYLKDNQMSFAYWSFNPNSGDTGGLVGDDWVTPQQAKLDALAPILTGGPPAPIPTISPRATNSPTPASTPVKLSSATPTVTTNGLRAQWELSSSWNAGYTAQLRLTSADRDRNGWTLRWRDPHATSIANAWGMSCTVASGLVTCTGADWARSIPVGQTVTVGVHVNSTGAAPTNLELTVS